MVLKQDKGRGVVVIDRKTYTEKYLILLNTDNFIQLEHDPANAIDGKIQKTIRKIKRPFAKLLSSLSNPHYTANSTK